MRKLYQCVFIFGDAIKLSRNCARRLSSADTNDHRAATTLIHACVLLAKIIRCELKWFWNIVWLRRRRRWRINLVLIEWEVIVPTVRVRVRKLKFILYLSELVYPIMRAATFNKFTTDDTCGTHMWEMCNGRIWICAI